MILGGEDAQNLRSDNLCALQMPLAAGEDAQCIMHSAEMCIFAGGEGHL